MSSTRPDLPGHLVLKPQVPASNSSGDEPDSLSTPCIDADHVKHELRHEERETPRPVLNASSFVPVSAVEDPLMPRDIFLPIEGQSSSATEEPATTNSTLAYFDRFTQDAKVASSHGKQEVLDELLMHEAAAQQTISHTPDFLDLVDQALEGSKNAESSPPQQPIIQRSQSDHSSRPRATRRPDHSPSRSSTLALPVVPAPPLADTHNVSSTTTPPYNNSTHNPFTPYMSTAHARSSSASALSNLSSRWMSSLLSHSSASSNSHHYHPALGSIFSTKPRSTSPERIITPPPHISDVHISHGTPFDKPKDSPFAPHVYIPPSGAPGYKGEQYDWDKGFSAELDSELNAVESTGRETETVDVHEQPGLLSHFIEKKLGGIELYGRRASTIPVLDLPLANLIRPHLPALARLPRKWTLLYSLDQHGISLNTLYNRCEAHMQVPPGVSPPVGSLVIVKDAMDGLFGVWLGKEGVRRSGGEGYYGTGDSFMWKYATIDHDDEKHGKLRIFKWTGRNDYFALCEPEFISFGGGDGTYGLYLDDTLYAGSSASCPTFGNEPLCSGHSGAFECVGLEVWGVGP
ncbi:hypothetical protein H0H87_000234 [Tephrocybe sp. NHM501043]|nr:hypothetical protein H0H87_000234 [Tephrocybe sp. NHM501043]